MTNGTVLVASPSAIGRQPEASGSSVPACPARLHENSRLMALTACVEVMPTALSSTIQPCTSRFSRRNCCFPFPCFAGSLSLPSPACGGGLGRGVGCELGFCASTSPTGEEVREFVARDSLLI